MTETEKADPVASLRAELLRDLPGDIKRVRNAYRCAAQQAALMRDAKDFNTHQAACKAALGHLDGLIKLLRWASEEGEDKKQLRKSLSAESSDDLIRTARKRMNYSSCLFGSSTGAPQL